MIALSDRKIQFILRYESLLEEIIASFSKMFISVIVVCSGL